MLSIKHWRSQHLLTAWAAYWVALAGVALGPALMAVARVSGPSGKGSASIGFGEGLVNMVVTNANGPTWSGAASLTSVAFWLAGPPLVLWAVWLGTRPTRRVVAVDGTGPAALGDGPAQRVDSPVRERDSATRE